MKTSSVPSQLSKSSAVPPPTGPWLDVQGAMAYLSMTAKAVYQAVRKGTLPRHRLGRKLLFSQPQLDAVIAAGSGPRPS